MGYPCWKASVNLKKLRTAQKGRVLPALLCSALLFSSLLFSSLLSVYGSCFILVNPFFINISKISGKAKPRLAPDLSNSYLIDIIIRQNKHYIKWEISKKVPDSARTAPHWSGRYDRIPVLRNGVLFISARGFFQYGSCTSSFRPSFISRYAMIVRAHSSRLMREVLSVRS